MGTDFVGELKLDIGQLQEYAREYRAGDKSNQPKLDRAVSLMVTRSFDSVKASLERESPDPDIELRRRENLRWRKIVTNYTKVIALLVVGATVASIWAVQTYGGGSSQAKLSYILYAVMAAIVIGLSVYVIRRLYNSTKEYLIECLLRYSPREGERRDRLHTLEDIMAGTYAGGRNREKE